LHFIFFSFHRIAPLTEYGNAGWQAFTSEVIGAEGKICEGATLAGEASTGSRYSPFAFSL
jgi:hypothetical protein